MNFIELIVEHELLGMMESAEKILQYACPCKFCCEPYHETNKPTFIIIIFFLHLEWMARQNNAPKILIFFVVSYIYTHP